MISQNSKNWICFHQHRDSVISERLRSWQNSNFSYHRGKHTLAKTVKANSPWEQLPYHFHLLRIFFSVSWLFLFPYIIRLYHAICIIYLHQIKWWCPSKQVNLPNVLWPSGKGESWTNACPSLVHILLLPATGFFWHFPFEDLSVHMQKLEFVSHPFHFSPLWGK